MNINTLLIDMDVLISEQVFENSDDSYTILLNSRLSHQRLLEAYNHALKHIKNHDFEKKEVEKIERDAHSA